ASTVSTEQPTAPQPPAAEPEPKQETPAPAPEATSESAAPESPASAPAASATNEVAPRATDPSSTVYVTPLVRKLARENNVDLSTLTGTGVGGRIRKQDVLDAAARAKESSSAPAQPATTDAPAGPAAGSARSAAQEVSPEAAALRGTTEKMSRLRKVIASRMVESLQVSAQLTATVEVDMTAVSRIRRAEKNAFKAREGVGLS
ncbi:E3 binding domain-containing protein, partial [Cutibacterium granulosum]